nr:DUF6321 domain-containing protein [Variovorax boronicumulans]
MTQARHEEQPWDHAAPRGTRSKSLTPAAKAAAKRRAKAAGRPYPNLVDNMQAAKRQKSAGKSTAAPRTMATAGASGRPAAKKTAAKKTATKKTAAKKSVAKKTAAKRPAARSASAKDHAGKSHAAKAQGRDPKGGLTAAGRAEFRRRDGAQLKPGVRKQRISDMTPEEMRRKGSWATRFFGRAELPALRDAHGKPTRFALSAHAWGEPVPRTEAAARRIAEKGRRLLERYRRLRDA